LARTLEAIALVKTVNGGVSWELVRPRVVR
jgi:hypothetical protein